MRAVRARAALPAGLDPGRDFQRLSDLYLEGTRLRLREVRAPDGAIVERKLNQKLPDPEGHAGRRVITSLYLDAAEYALLSALVLAEVELETDAELAALPLPAFARCEVTALPLFTGGALAREDPARVLAEARRLLAEP